LGDNLTQCYIKKPAKLFIIKKRQEFHTLKNFLPEMVICEAYGSHEIPGLLIPYKSAKAIL
jgi:hypothetical protein